MRLPDFAGTTPFSWTLAMAGAFVLCTSVLLGFVYWQAAGHMTSTINGLLTDALGARSCEVRFTSMNGHRQADPAGPKSANRRHC